MNSGGFFAGIDLGSTMTKVVIIDGNEKTCASIIRHTGAEHRQLAHQVMDQALQSSGLGFDDISYLVATGYGRMTVPFADKQVTELTCHTRGVFSLFPRVRLAIDIGGQDSKVMQIKGGKLIDFAMNDKCAAGTGRYLEIIAATLGLNIEDIGPLSMESTKKVQISSTCTVFAQQEVILQISEGTALEDILAGVHDSIANRITRMAGRLSIEPEVVFTGGVAKNSGMVRALESSLGCNVSVPKEPLLSGATGAALLAKEIVFKAQAEGKPLSRVEHNLDGVKFYS
ncbi:MAG: 2-hydroxyglutaryl-CoA dehydratase [Dehalococcoidales bacterium]|nr:2-hydroxyglutaryl-CoA dehydratase [Dehalococcoidales bacterium]